MPKKPGPGLNQVFFTHTSPQRVYEISGNTFTIWVSVVKMTTQAGAYMHLITHTTVSVDLVC